MVKTGLGIAAVLMMGATAANAEGTKIGYEWRVESANSSSTIADDEEATDGTSLNRQFKIIFSSNPTEKTTFKARLNLLKDQLGTVQVDTASGAGSATVVKGLGQTIDWAFMGYKINDKISLNVGKMKSRTYGFAYRHANSTNAVGSAFTDMNKNRSVEGVGIEYKLNIGQITLVSGEDAEHSWNADKGTSGNLITFEYLGSFGAISPLIQYAVYDFGHSNTMSVGARYMANNVDVTVDYVMDNVSTKGTNSAGDYEDQVANQVGMNIAVDYMMGDYTPFFRYSTWNVDEYLAEGATAVEYNSAAGTYNDNKNYMAVGSYFDGIGGKAYRPYFAYRVTGGKFVTTKTVKGADLSKTEIVVGLSARWM